jgi:RNA polymerase sigma factor (sigma-70 family)
VSRHNEQAVKSSASDTQDERLRLLGEVIEREQQELLNDIAFQLRRFRLTDGAGLEALAKEVLQETVVQASKIADRYDPAGEALLWLRAIATKVILRRRSKRRLEQSRFSLIGDTQPVRRAGAENLSEEKMLELLSRTRGRHTPSQTSSAEEILSHVAGDDQKILRLYYVEGLDGEELAAQFGTSVGAVHQRLCRARIKLRQAYLKGEN